VSRPEDIERLESIQELIEDLWQVPRFARGRQGFRPHFDAYRTDEPPLLVVMVELPGVAGEDLRVAVDERTLVVAGERRRPEIDGKRSYQQMEIEWGPFERRITLGEDVESNAVEASLERGLLTVRLPVAAKPKPRKPVRLTITVQVHR
jgi:HSP20 family protein